MYYKSKEYTLLFFIEYIEDIKIDPLYTDINSKYNK